MSEGQLGRETAMICPCQALQVKPKPYADCCQPLHSGTPAATCEGLMRSRYSGFVLGLSQYIKDTWHDSSRPADLQLAADSQWLKLDILASSKNQVHFRAYFKHEDGGYQVLDETSDFVFQGRWLYLKGDASIKPHKPSANEPCLCGSGKKFKKCCRPR
ncbi:MAG: YchJ family metal-binding protein [Bermanella sp.]